MLCDEFLPLTRQTRVFYRGLRHSTNRSQHGLFLVEGSRLCGTLIGSNVEPVAVVVNKDASDEVLQLGLDVGNSSTERFISDSNAFNMISTVEQPQHILAVCPVPDEASIIGDTVFLDSVADPGNVGTIIRSSEWFGVKNIVVYGATADPFSPKAVRSSAGAIFSTNIVRVKNADDWFSLRTEKVIATTPTGGTNIHDCKYFDSSVVILIGSEAHGISTDVVKHADVRITIPGIGSVESLNAAMVAAITLFSLRSPERK